MNSNQAIETKPLRKRSSNIRDPKVVKLKPILEKDNTEIRLDDHFEVPIAPVSHRTE